MAQRRASRAPAAPDPAAEDRALPFEEALEKLEGIVARLERGDLPLEEALGAFEEGVALTRQCAERLDSAERRIEVLVQEGERWLAKPFEAPEEDD